MPCWRYYSLPIIYFHLIDTQCGSHSACCPSGRGKGAVISVLGVSVCLVQGQWQQKDINISGKQWFKKDKDGSSDKLEPQTSTMALIPSQSQSRLQTHLHPFTSGVVGIEHLPGRILSLIQLLQKQRKVWVPTHRVSQVQKSLLNSETAIPEAGAALLPYCSPCPCVLSHCGVASLCWTGCTAPESLPGRRWHSPESHHSHLPHGLQQSRHGNSLHPSVSPLPALRSSRQEFAVSRWKKKMQLFHPFNRH